MEPFDVMIGEVPIYQRIRGSGERERVKVQYHAERCVGTKPGTGGGRRRDKRSGIKKTAGRNARPLAFKLKKLSRRSSPAHKPNPDACYPH